MHFTISMLRIEDMSFQEKDVQIKYPNIIIHVLEISTHFVSGIVVTQFVY